VFPLQIGTFRAFREIPRQHATHDKHDKQQRREKDIMIYVAEPFEGPKQNFNQASKSTHFTSFHFINASCMSQLVAVSFSLAVNVAFAGSLHK
jgi:hypothetical protein